MASTWSYKSQSSSYRGKLQCIFDQGKGNLVRVGGKIGRRGGLMVKCARLRSERSGFEPWPGTVCCVLGQDTLLSQCLSPPRCINGYLLFVGET